MKQLKKGIILLLALTLMVCSLTSCSGGETAMRYGSQTLDESDYAYLMAFIKGYYEYYYSYMAAQSGYQMDLDQLMEQDIGDGKTLADSLTEAVEESAKMLLVVEQLCAEAGLTIQDAESLAEISKAMQEMEDEYGGADAMQIELAKLGLKASSVERYERYNLLLTLLRDYRYGENGIARIAAEEVRKEFEQNYAKAEAFLYSYLMPGSGGNNTQYQYDFAADYTTEEVNAYFSETFLKVNYLQFDDVEAAGAAYEALKNGTAKFEDYYDADACKKHQENAYLGKNSVSDTIYAGLQGTAENAWYLSGEEGDYTYVMCRLPMTETAPDEETGKLVRTALLDRDARAYFAEQFITVRHILYKDEAKAKQVYEAILEGTTTFAEHESETADSAKQYTFTHGTMVDAFEEAAYQTAVGAYALVESEHGWHILYRLELDAAGYQQSEVTAAMSRDRQQTLAQAHYEKLLSGESKFEKPADDAGYSYAEPSLLKLSEQNEELREALKNAKDGETVLLNIDGYGVFILRKSATTDEDLADVYDAVEEPLISDALYEYLKTFFDAVVINTAVTGRFDIRTAKSFYY